MNNPLIYTDPDGEFWHLIIGAAIGGIVNWATHGAEFSWQGLGYFGVGAVAGALGAGIGAGISSALPIAGQVSGGFAAGFWGTSAATTATSSFVSGALVGGGSGLASGFTTGFGNALVDGKNFGQALGQGGIYGAIGLGSGALIGGIVGGIDAAKDGRDFLDGAYELNFIADDPNYIPGEGECVPYSNKASFRTTDPDFSQYNMKDINEIDYETLKNLNDNGYNRAHISVRNYLNKTTGEYEPHRMAIKQIRYKPNQNFFKVKVFDSGSITLETTSSLIRGTSTSIYNQATYNLLRSPSFIFRTFYLWAPK